MSTKHKAKKKTEVQPPAELKPPTGATEAKILEEAIEELKKSPAVPEAKVIEKKEVTIAPTGEKVVEESRAVAVEKPTGEIEAKAETVTKVESPAEATVAPPITGTVTLAPPAEQLAKVEVQAPPAPPAPPASVAKRSGFIDAIREIATKYRTNVKLYNTELKRKFVKAELKGIGKIDAKDLPNELVDTTLHFLRTTEEAVFVPRAVYELRISPTGGIISEKLMVGNRDIIQELKPSKVVTHLQGYVNLDKYPDEVRVWFSDRVGLLHDKASNTLLIGRDERSVTSLKMGQRLKQTIFTGELLEKLGIKVPTKRRVRVPRKREERLRELIRGFTKEELAKILEEEGIKVQL